MGGRKLQTSILLPTKINHQEKKVNHSHKIRWQKIRVQCSTLTTLENRRTGYRIQIQIYLTRCTSSSELDEIWLFKCYGFVQNGFVEKALETFKRMQLVGVKPNSTTFASILTACAKMGALEQGMNIHQSIMVWGFIQILWLEMLS
ncbi:pentatricopeptide repeat-containing protein At5g66520 isoform X2 [Cryptomeria japonica]|uniref:pentatricopeptide repeat-containing protein At5g66520 isoform X2 n=1 Tax=Cryptomeria japonica TaxID=3369 RepID=UPI0027DA3F21|nr:pentatricopeptide repeat-containing protein At5g66520 isoform X2 [Cryptomeria japonica]